MTFNPVLLDIPESFDSERLFIRAARPGDGAAHFAALQESHDDLRAHLADLPWVKAEASLANSEIFCRENWCRFIRREDLRFFMFSKSDASFIGSIGLHRIDWAVPKFEIGYWCRVSAQGNGYVGEAVHAITNFVIQHLAARRIEIRADDLNVSSWKVAEKAGFKLEGILRSAARDSVSNQLKDMRIYAKVVD
ncbi:GNAT family N-acetyltransferase [Solimicrobium silvestre]|nr:GNAT family N-acetyltransferase [Solimicrobium silvestre]